MPSFAVAFAVALVASLGLTPGVRRLALRVGMVDHPNARKVHVTPMPLMGGLAIYLGFVLAVLVSLGSGARAEILAIVAAGTLLAVVGMLDDRGLLHHQIKLMVAMPAAALILMVAGIRSHVVSHLFPGPASIWIDVALTVFWVVGITASFSILDHMDGLCAGAATVSAACITLLAVSTGQVLVATLGAAAFGASLGFLHWNFNPAKIFMGDGGAMFLGFLMATLGLKLRFMDMPQATSWMVPVLALGIPVLDTTLVIVSRSRRGLIPFAAPGKDHAAHRLSNLGLGQRGAVLALYGWGGVFGLAAFWMTRLDATQGMVLGATMAGVILAGVMFLERAPYERQSKRSAAL